MGSRFYLLLSIKLCLSFLFLFLLVFFVFQLKFSQKNQEFLKEKVKTASFTQTNRLNKKIDSLIKDIQKIQTEQEISPKSPLTGLFFLHSSLSLEGYKKLAQLKESSLNKKLTQLKKPDSNKKLTHKNNANENNKGKKASKFNDSDVGKNNPNESPADQNILTFYSRSTKDFNEEELLDLLNSIPKLPLETIYFKKVKHGRKNKNFVFVSSKGFKAGGFLKDNFFNLQKGKTPHLFFTMDKNKNLFFYGEKEKSIKQKFLSQAIELFLEKSTPRYFYVQSKKDNRKKEIYYFQKWEGTNLILINKKLMTYSFFDMLLGLKQPFISLFFVLLALFFIMFLCLFYLQVSSLVYAYSFLKHAFNSFVKIGLFPEVDSKNPLLSFYRNREIVFNQKRQMSDAQADKKESMAQEIIEEELKKATARCPNLIIQKQFQTDVKLFGFERFLRMIVSELLANAIEAMGAMKEPKLDISIKEEGAWFFLSMRDYGVGFKDPKKIFEMYYSTKSQMGVGLKVAQSIIKANKGELTLKSLEEGGVQADVKLPISCFLKK